MDKFIAHTDEEYWKEKDRREKIYREACKTSGELCDKYLVEKKDEYHDAFFEAFRKLDPAYMAWQDGVIYESKEWQ